MSDDARVQPATHRCALCGATATVAPDTDAWTFIVTCPSCKSVGVLAWATKFPPPIYRPEPRDATR